MRITKKVFTDLTIFMILLGVVVGIVFPFFMVWFGVPKAIAFKPLFFSACIIAGILLAVMNIGLARKVVGARIKLLSKQMKHVEGMLTDRNQQADSEKCTPENCAITVDSQDELGESAEAFNRLIYTLSDVMEAQTDLQQFSEMLTAHLDLEMLAYETLQHLVKGTQASGGAILAEHNGELDVITSYAMQDSANLANNAMVLHTLNTHERQIIRFPEGIVLDGVITDYHPRELLVEPIMYKQVLIGIILLAGVTPFIDKDMEKLGVYGPILSMAFNNAITHQQMQQLAALDSLTGIYNRRFGYNRIQEEFGRAIRTNTALSLIMLDIDHFKIVNDTYGHNIGDKIIVMITKAIKSAMRDGDLLIRYGGEEFLCVLPGASQHDANIIAQRIRIMVADSILKENDQSMSVTVSLGTATFPGKDIADIQQFIGMADEAMYSAKNTGRNRVVSV